MNRTIVLSLALLASSALAARGNLVIVGGALRSDNVPVNTAFLNLAGGKDKANIVIVSTASSSLSSSRRFKADMEAYGVAPDRVTILDVTSKNAADQTKNAGVVEAINRATAVWFVGGDQGRLYKAWTTPDGQDTPALKAVKALYFDRGGTIGGSSAGASIQGELMPSAYGIPMDTLDFGLAAKAEQRGVYVSKGFGFFPGIIDQHFNTYDGRPVRMASYLIERKLGIGYGLDEDTALVVTPDLKLEVLGAAGVTIMDARNATRQDSPLGVRIQNVVLNRLESGDKYDPASGVFTLNPKKALIKPGDEYVNGNRLITDLSQSDAYTRALTLGLVDNTAAKQEGLYLRLWPGYGYGYKVTLSKTPQTQGYYGSVAGIDGYAVLGARMDVEPVTAALGAPRAPSDVRTSAAAKEITAVAFRGLLPPTASGQFRPAAPVTRAELAGALVNTTGVSLKTAPKLSDIAGNVHADNINIVVSRGWLAATGDRFDPNAPVTRAEAAAALLQAYDWTQFETPKPGTAAIADLASAPEARREAIRAAVGGGLLSVDASGRVRPGDPITREELAVALYKVAGFKF